MHPHQDVADHDRRADITSCGLMSRRLVGTCHDYGSTAFLSKAAIAAFAISIAVIDGS